MRNKLLVFCLFIGLFLFLPKFVVAAGTNCDNSPGEKARFSYVADTTSEFCYTLTGNETIAGAPARSLSAAGLANENSSVSEEIESCSATGWEKANYSDYNLSVAKFFLVTIRKKVCDSVSVNLKVRYKIDDGGDIGYVYYMGKYTPTVVEPVVATPEGPSCYCDLTSKADGSTLHREKIAGVAVENCTNEKVTEVVNSGFMSLIGTGVQVNFGNCSDKEYSSGSYAHTYSGSCLVNEKCLKYGESGGQLADLLIDKTVCEEQEGKWYTTLAECLKVINPGVAKAGCYCDITSLPSMEKVNELIPTVQYSADCKNSVGARESQAGDVLDTSILENCQWYGDKAVEEGKKNNGPLFAGLEGSIKELNQLGTTDANKMIGRIIKAIMGVMGTVALLMFVYGGILLMTAAGNSERAGEARKILIWTSMGLIVILGSYGLVDFIFQAFN